MPSILVIDNNRPTLEFVAEVLRDEGYAVAGAQTPTDARAAILEQRPDLLLVDFHLQDMKGDVLAADLRSEGLTGVPILFMTSDERKAIERKLDGTDVCLLKPFELDDLLDCVAQYLQPKQAQATH